MADRKTGNELTLQKKVKVLEKLYKAGCRDERSLYALAMETILKIPGITVSDMTVIMELKKYAKSGKLFSYLANDSTEIE